MRRSSLEVLELDLQRLKKALEYGGPRNEIEEQLSDLINDSLNALDSDLRRISHYRKRRENILSHGAVRLFKEIATEIDLSYESRRPVLEIFAKHYLTGRYSKELDRCVKDVEEKLGLDRTDIGRILLQRNT